ncbi:alanine racemase [Virgibacillus kekensis]|uniref:Alanine racemase n=1 Tax=Virgibacillus kekensis TaxID=202261 RepID=A0ABV9DFU9_9BACI
MTSSFSPTVAEIDLEAFRYNVENFSQLASNSLLMAVIKTDAYGHGAVPIGKEAIKAGADRLGVTSVEEGISLRENGVEVPIHLLSAVFSEQAADVVKHDLTASVSTSKLAESLSKEALTLGKKIPVHLKIDTGLHRFGITPAESISFCRDTYGLSGLEWEGIYTHFSSADEGNWETTERQFDLFLKTVMDLKRDGFEFPIRHAGASTIAIERNDMHLDMIRPGAALFGYQPEARQKELVTLKPVLRLKSRLLSVREFPPNTPVGYGGNYVTDRNQRLAVVPIGHGDGYQRSLSNKGEMLVNGKRAKIAGTISLDQTIIDVTDIPDVREGDEVVIIGRQGDDAITAREVAGWMDSIVDEVLASLMGRVRRIYH